MLFKKDKNIISVNHGSGRTVVGPLRGTIENIIIHPRKPKDINGYVIYDFKVLDEQNDEIFFQHDIVGKYRNTEPIPVGKSTDERITCIIENSNYNIDFEIILLTKER